MSRSFIWALSLGAMVLLGVLLWFQTDIHSKFSTSAFTSKAHVERVQFSVVRYNGKIVSARLMLDGAGTLQVRHRIRKEDVDIAFYEHKETIDNIQRASKARYIVSEHGFTHEVIEKEVELQ